MTKVPGILLLALEPKGHPSMDMSVGSDAFKGPGSKCTKLQGRDMSPNDNLENLARETQQSASEKESKNLAVGLIERELWFQPNQVPLEPPVPPDDCTRQPVPRQSERSPKPVLARRYQQGHKKHPPHWSHCPECNEGKPAGPASGH